MKSTNAVGHISSHPDNTIRITVGVLLIGLWELSSRFLIDPFWISRPTHIVVRLWEWYSTGFFFHHLAATLLEIGVGFFIGLFSTILVSVLLGNIILFGGIDFCRS